MVPKHSSSSLLSSPAIEGFDGTDEVRDMLVVGRLYNGLALNPEEIL
jgi:hypothetical protein